jgi:hypothetical protein
MKIIKIMVIYALSVDSPWTEKTEFGCGYCQKKIPWNPWNIHGVHESMWTPQGLPGGVISPPQQGSTQRAMIDDVFYN